MIARNRPVTIASTPAQSCQVGVDSAPAGGAAWGVEEGGGEVGAAGRAGASLATGAAALLAGDSRARRSGRLAVQLISWRLSRRLGRFPPPRSRPFRHAARGGYQC